ncbi:MAG: amino acid adenylation domain-containing protein [Lentisphaeria bacterium]|jgi:amino acid adenylation domain-containing protein
MALQHYLTASAEKYPDRPAVVEPGVGSISYADFNRLTDRVRDRLLHLGVSPGRRVGIMVHKTIDSVACIFGILKAGAAYVPVDVTGPVPRAAYILTNCEVDVVFVESALEEKLKAEMMELGGITRVIAIGSPGMGLALATALDVEDQLEPAAKAETHNSQMSDLAYILYTSGSTGRPKGVPLTHHNGVAFVDWCSDVFTPSCEDRFSAHAPFHFDLSILDLYTPIKHGAAIVLIGEELGKEPALLAQVMSSEKITIWYSAPSILTMLLQFGDIGKQDLSGLRAILFAGEVFPVRHLRALLEQVPYPKYFNLYGPTETNVCTYCPVPHDFISSGLASLPIGPVCHHLQAMVVGVDGEPVKAGEIGELIIAGGNVMAGYWNLPEQTASAFFEKPDARYYRTGDLVIESAGGVYTYSGRRDRMIKKRGFRVELGEIEAKLHLHENILEAAVVAIANDEGVQVHAHYVTADKKKISVIKLKKFSSEHLPVYMVPDTFTMHETLPKTSTDKVDYQTLKRVHEEA